MIRYNTLSRCDEVLGIGLMNFYLFVSILDRIKIGYRQENLVVSCLGLNL